MTAETAETADRRNSLDAYRPPGIAALVRTAGVEKARLPLAPLVARGAGRTAGSPLARGSGRR